jgi:predicted alpha/beta superfamily hydrolase
MYHEIKRFIPTTNSERSHRIWVPETCSKDHPCDVLYMHDAQNLFSDELSYHEVSWRVIDGMKQADVDHVIIVGIDNSDIRLDEYSPFVTTIELKDRFIKGLGGKGDIYVDYIEHDLIPFIEANYAVTKNRYIAGSSMGAYISVYAAAKYPNTYKGVGSFSIASWFNEDALLNAINASSLSTEQMYYVSIGRHESSSNDIKEFPEIYLKNSENLVRKLKRKGIKTIHYNINDGAHNERQWMNLFPEFCKLMFK